MISYAAIREGELLSRVAVPGHLAVAPEFQGRGIGSALVRRVVALADDRGGPVVVLQGSPGFYGRLGFEPEEAAQVLRLSNCISRSAERPTRVRDSDRGLTHHL
jgi:putative acetyltransferase